jgi:hypothetical protein
MGEAEKKIRQLPQELQSEVEDFIDFLIEKRASLRKKKPTFNWIGGLKEFRDRYTSLELQKMASQWRD